MSDIVKEYVISELESVLHHENVVEIEKGKSEKAKREYEIAQGKLSKARSRLVEVMKNEKDLNVELKGVVYNIRLTSGTDERIVVEEIPIHIRKK